MIASGGLPILSLAWALPPSREKARRITMEASTDQLQDLLRGTVDALPAGRLAEQLAAGRPPRVKLGIDPPTPHTHLGHSVVLNKLRAFQDLGHTVALIVGDYTARVGDPS